MIFEALAAGGGTFTFLGSIAWLPTASANLVSAG